MEKKKNNPIYLGFASQKGGVGKSSFAEVLASILYYEKNISLAVVDCDGTQESFYKLSPNATETSSNPRPNWARNFMNACRATARNRIISSEANQKEPFPMS